MMGLCYTSYALFIITPMEYLRRCHIQIIKLAQCPKDTLKLRLVCSDMVDICHQETCTHMVVLVSSDYPGSGCYLFMIVN